MNICKPVSTILGVALLSTLVVLANGQTTDEAARDLARNAVRSELHLRPDQFIVIHRDEELEQSLAIATVGWRADSFFIYRVSQTGVEIKEKAIVRHIATDADLMYIIAVSSKDGSTFRIHGFADSLAEFNKLMTTSKMNVSSPEQAESLADFYRGVNPENVPLTPISSLIELKQAAERQCRNGAKSFDAGQEAFTTWWNRAKPLYAALSFQENAVRQSSGYVVLWILLSSPAIENCGGSPLRAKLEIGQDGHVGKLIVSPLKKG